jgi:hypothetical protein
MPVANQKRFFIFVGIILFIILIVAVAATNAAAPKKPILKPTPTPTIAPTLGPPPTVSFTVKAAVGVQTIAVTNQNTGSTMTLVPADLPITLNCKYGDTLTFKVTSAASYRFNTWMFGDSTFDNHNPLNIKVAYPFMMEARFLTDVTIG